MAEEPLSNAATEPTIDEFVDFLLPTCRILMECGCSSNRVEQLLSKLGSSWGFDVEAAAIPTCVWISVRRGNSRIHEMTRIRNWSVDLDRLAKINDLVDQIYLHTVTVPEAAKRLESIATSSPPWGTLATVLAGGGTSVGLLYFYGASTNEMLVAFPAGMMVQAMQKYVFTNEAKRYLSDFLSATLVATIAVIAQRYIPDIDSARVTVGGLIGLVPGLALVNAVHEIAQKNLLSGVGKLIEAMIISLSLVFGVFFVFGTLTLFGFGSAM